MNLTMMSLRSGIATSWQGVNAESNVGSRFGELITRLPRGHFTFVSW
jgi:hypothetical protein